MNKDRLAVKGEVRGHACATINRSATELYEFWRDVEKAPLWQEGVQSVKALDERRSHWVMIGPGDKKLEWTSEITHDEPSHRISWKSLEPEIQQSGEVTFEKAPGDRGTIVTLTQCFELPGGKLANAVAGIIARSPRQIVVENLRHFKQLTEAGEIPTIEDQPTGPRGLSGKVKEFALGETNPTPPGSSSRAVS